VVYKVLKILSFLKPQKKMKKIILIFNLIVSVYSLNSINYCLIDNKKDNCISYYDDNNNNYITKCSNSDCNGEYNYKCLTDQCSINKLVCDQFKQINHLIKSLTNSNLLYLQMERMRQFKQTFKLCPKQQVNIFNSSQLCSNKKQICAYYYNYNIRGIKRKAVVKEQCECTGKYNNECGNYCTTNQISCDTWKKVDKTNFVIDNCKYDSKIIEKNIRLNI